MAFIKPEEFYASIKTNSFKSVYMFCGEESFLQEEALIFVKNKFGMDSLNIDTFYAGENSIDDAILAAKTLPFILEKRLVVIKNANKLKSAETSKFKDFLNAPVETACIIFVWPEKLRKDKKNELLLKIEKNGAIVEFRTLYDNELPEWIKGRFKKNKRIISNEAVDYLAMESGPGLFDLNNEIEKIVIFVGDKNEISLKDVQQISGHARQNSLNNLSEAIEQKKTIDAVKIVETLLHDGEIPLKILAAIYRVVRRLFIAKSMIEENKMPPAKIKSELYLNPYFDRNFFVNLARYNYHELEKALSAILCADNALKSSSGNENMIFEELIFSLGNN